MACWACVLVALLSACLVRVEARLQIWLWKDGIWACVLVAVKSACWVQVLGDLLVYPNRMSFDIMEGGGKAPEPVGLLVCKVKAVTNLKGGGDLFSKVVSSTLTCFPKAVQGRIVALLYAKIL